MNASTSLLFCSSFHIEFIEQSKSIITDNNILQRFELESKYFTSFDFLGTEIWFNACFGVFFYTLSVYCVNIEYFDHIECSFGGDDCLNVLP